MLRVNAEGECREVLVEGDHDYSDVAFAHAAVAFAHAAARTPESVLLVRLRLRMRTMCRIRVALSLKVHVKYNTNTNGIMKRDDFFSTHTPLWLSLTPPHARQNPYYWYDYDYE